MPSFQPYFSIIGPTAVGKTDLAVWLAYELLESKHYKGIDIISADSRQVYQGLEILSGADVPREFSSVVAADNGLSFYSLPNGEIRLYGISIIKPDQDWSVAHFQQLVKNILSRSGNEERLAIIVGGTGLYHQHLANPDQLLHVPPNAQLRQDLQDWSVADLQALLMKLDRSKLEAMNGSDSLNPRRLMRAIEVAKHQPSKIEVTGEVTPIPDPLLTIGVSDSLPRIKARIEQRVRDRFSKGAQSEVAQLIAEYDDWKMPAFTTTGVKELKAFMEDRITVEECLEHWAVSEFQYAKRQFTWWKKRAVSTWVSVQYSDWKESALNSVLAIL